MIQILQTFYGDLYNSVTTNGQILSTTIELFLEIKHLGKLFTKSNFCSFTHENLQLQLQILW